MTDPISEKSEMTRMDAACGLAILAREVCNEVEIFTFSNNLIQVPNRRGFALRDAILRSQPYSGTVLGQALEYIKTDYSRIIVFTDEHYSPKGKGYIINVAPYRNGIGYGPWTHIDGFSEACLDYITEIEK